MTSHPQSDPNFRLKRLHADKMETGQDHYFDLVEGRLQPLASQRHWLSTHQQKMMRLLNLQPTDRFLDLGCGEGYYTLPLSKKARQAVGIDFTAGALQILKTQQGYDSGRLHLVNASGSQVPLMDASIDKLLCNHVLEHVLDDDAFVSEFHRLLKPGGLLLIGVPISFSPQVRLLIGLRRLLRPRSRALRLEQVQPGRLVPELVGVENHIRFYSLQAVKDLLARNGFKVLRAEGVGVSLTESVRSFVRRSGPLFTAATAVGRVFPSTGDGVLVLGQRK